MGRYWTASLTWPGPMGSLPSRSAMVRATLRMRSKARAERCSDSSAERSVRAASAVGVDARPIGVAAPLDLSRLLDALADGGRGLFAARFAAELVGRQGGSVDVQIEAVEQRAGEPPPVGLAQRRRAETLLRPGRAVV